MPERQVLTIERTGSVATLWLDRPDARNAMGPAFWEELPLAMEELGVDDGVRAVVVAARGPHFSVGLDLNLPVGTSLARAGCGLPKNAASATAAWLTGVGWVLRVLAWTFAALFIAGFTSAVRKT